MWSNASYRAVLREFDDCGVPDPEWTDLCFAKHDHCAVIAKPLTPSKVVDGGVNGLQEDSKVLVTADDCVRYEGGDEFGVGCQRLHQGVNICGC